MLQEWRTYERLCLNTQLAISTQNKFYLDPLNCENLIDSPQSVNTGKRKEETQPPAAEKTSSIFKTCSLHVHKCKSTSQRLQFWGRGISTTWLNHQCKNPTPTTKSKTQSFRDEPRNNALFPVHTHAHTHEFLRVNVTYLGTVSQKVNPRGALEINYAVPGPE